MQEIIQFLTQHPTLGLIWVILFISIIFITLQNWFSKVEEVTCDRAIFLINRENAITLDLRDRNEYCKGHIVNSLNVTSTTIKSGTLGILEKSKNKPIIVICKNGSTSRYLAKYLLKLGFTRVYFLKEGISGWKERNLPLVDNK